MVFSYTAPAIDEEQEKAEYEALSEEEKQIRQDKLNGTFALPEESEHDMAQAPKLLREALESIPNDEKEAYLEAMERVPELVARESNPLAFMRAEQFNAWAAARRLVDYWKLRKSLFGEVRAFLPMTMDGAMADDMDTLRLGIFQRLPNDEHGRAVFFGDRVRCIPSVAPRDSILRSCFYIIHVVCEDEAAQKKGTVSVANLKGFNLVRHFDRAFTLQGRQIMDKCMPMYVCALHMRCSPGRSFMNVVMPVFKHIMGKNLRLHLVLHSGTDKELLASLEESFGMKRENLSYRIGGGFTESDYENWLAERRLFEVQRQQRQEQQR